MKRLFEDPEVPAELQADLRRSMEAGKRYDAASHLPQVLDAISKAGAASEGAAASGLGKIAEQTGLHALPAAVKLAAVVAAGAAAVALAVVVLDQPTSARSDGATGEAARSEGASAALEPSAVARSPVAAEGDSSRQASSFQAESSATRREIAMVVRIRRQLATDPAAAYQLALRAEREFVNGVLSEEREALLIQALAAMGKKEEAARRAQDFVKDHAASPLRGVIEKSTEE